MPNTIEQAVAYARANPTNRGGTWHNWCEAFVYRAGGFTRSFSTAQLAARASGPLNPAFAKAPRGALHYWSDASGFGHIGFELGGGLVLMASNGVTSLWGRAIGTATVPEYNRNKPDMHYSGWSLRHGTETLAPSLKPAPAAVSVTPAAPAAVGKPITLPITLKRTRKKPTMLGFAMTNHGITQWAVGVEKGVWLPVETQDDATAIAAIIGSFTVISVAAWNATKDAYLGTPTA
jgi:hypothetical protein